MNTMLWIALIVSLMGNAVIGYLFWRAVKQCGRGGVGNDCKQFNKRAKKM